MAGELDKRTKMLREMNDKQPPSDRTEANDDVESVGRSMPNESQPKSEKQNNDSRPSTKTDAQPEKRKYSKAKQLWEKTGLDVMTLGVMLKGSIPPLVALSMMQSNAVISRYSALGYLVAITSILGFCIMPRGKFIQTILLNLLAICLAAAVNLLALYSAIQARLNTTSPLAEPYNSSASAICAIWLFLQTYLVNTVRCARPQYQFPCIVYSIFTNISLTSGTQFTSITIAISFMQRLLETFATGFALATATHFLILPTTSRKAVFNMMTGYMGLINTILQTQTSYMASLEGLDPVEMHGRHQKAADNSQKSKGKNGKAAPRDSYNTASLEVRELLDKLTGLHAKIYAEILPARQEIAIGNLESHEITELWNLLRMVFVPVMGLCSMMTILEREAVARSLGGDGVQGKDQALRGQQVQNVVFMTEALHKPFVEMTANLDEAFKHILLTLGFVKTTKKPRDGDLESKACDGSASPGSSGFAEAFKQRLDNFYMSKQHVLQEWCEDHGIDPPANAKLSGTSFIQPVEVVVADEPVRGQVQRYLSLILYVQYLLWRVGTAVLDLVLFVDKREQSGASKRSKIIFPGSKTLYHWLKHVAGREDISQDDFRTADNVTGVSQSVYLGERFNQRRDPEHDPPSNAVERFGKLLRKVSNFFRSDTSVFALRATLATMSIAIICYLRTTQTFFLRNRLLWSMNVVALSMTRTAGQSIFNFIVRVAVTAVATVGSYIIWYIVAGHIPGVLFFLWLWIFCSFYIVVKMPKMIVAGILSLVTCVLAVGYEIQVRKIGIQESEGNGQPAYPLYILAPYRLATVVAGIFSAFFWTLFPYPISESTELRKDLGSLMYLMGLYHHLAHESVKGAIEITSSNASVRGMHTDRLQETRNTVLIKLVALSSQLSVNAAFSKFQISIGGRFPRERYESLIACLRRLMLWTTLAHYTSSSFKPNPENERTQWFHDFRQILANVNSPSQRITSVLFVLSSSLRTASPLPPHLELPDPSGFTETLFNPDVDISSVRHMAEPEYSAFAVMRVVSENIAVETEELVKLVKSLVGEVDFAFYAN